MDETRTQQLKHVTHDIYQRQTHPAITTMPSALVTGATGILGREIISELDKDKQTWPTVYALSRSKKDTYADNVKHQHIDLQASARDMAKELEHVFPDYVFFAAVSHRSRPSLLSDH